MTPAKKPAAKRKRAPKKPAGPPADLLEPWDRQPGESDEAWTIWQHYRDMPLPRSQRRAAREQGKGMATTAKHSDRWGWVQRAQLWDVEQDRVRTRATLAAQEELGRRHAAMARGHLQAIAGTMQETLRRIALPVGAPGRIDLETLEPEALLRLEAGMARAFPRVAQAERLALGMNTEGPPAKDETADARRLSDEEIRRRLQGMDGDDASAVESFLAGADAGRIAEREKSAREMREAEQAREALT